MDPPSQLTEPVTEPLSAPLKAPTLPGSPQHGWRRYEYQIAWYGLTSICALIDVVCFVALGGVFASMMTGNLLLLAVSVGSGSGWIDVGRQALPIAMFAVGAVLGARLMRTSDLLPKRMQSWRLGFALEWLFLVCATVLAWRMDSTELNATSQMIVTLLGLSMGVHGAMVRGHGVPDLGSNVMTTILATLMADTRIAKGDSKHWQRRSVSICVFFVAGIMGALLLKVGSMAVPLSVACLILTAALYSLMTATPPSRD